VSYVKDPFNHDIFVSYSHGDVDGTNASPLKAWSQGFVKVLEEELKTASDEEFTHELARNVSIFLDQDHRPSQGIDPMEPLGDQLKSEVGQSAILLVLSCRQYLESAWCTKEREWWVERQKALGLPFLDRIAAASVFRTELRWPPPVGDADGKLPFTGFTFIDPQDARPYEWPVPLSTSRGPFRAELVKMVGVIGQKLFALRKHLDERRAAAADAAKLQSDDQKVLYLHGSASQVQTWDRAFERLTSSGYSVFPVEPDATSNDPAGLETVRQQRVETMSRCDALLLLATDDGRAADADLVVVGRQDRNSAKARSKKLMPCALLDTAGLATSTPKRPITAKNLNVQWIDATNDPWTPRVKQWLTDAGAGGG